MQNIEVYDKPQSQQHTHILNTLKEWYHDNEVHLSPIQGQSLFNICKQIFDICQQEIKQISARLEETIKNRHQISDRLIEYQRENIDFKHMIERYEQEKKEISVRLQESVRELQREKQQNSAQMRTKQKIEKEKLELSIHLDKKEQEIFSLNLSLQNLKGEISQMSQRDSVLMKTNRDLKQKCESYQISDEIMRCQNEQLKAQVNKLKQLIEQKRELINKYVSSQQIDQSESVAERGSIYAASDYGDQVQYQENQDNQNGQQGRHVFESNRQLLHDIEQNCDHNLKMSGYYGRKLQGGFSPYDSENSHSKLSVVSNSSQPSVDQKKKFSRSKNQANYNSQECLGKIIIESKQKRKKSQAASPYKVNLLIQQKSSQQSVSPKCEQKRVQNLQQQVKHQRKIISQLREQISFLKRNNQKSAPTWTRSYRHQDFDQLQNKVQFYKRISHENHERFLEMRNEKQYYEILSRTMKQQFELHEHKYRQVFAQKLNQLTEEHTKRANRFGAMFQKGISKLKELNHELILENKYNAQKDLKKDEFNIMLNDLPSQEILDLNSRDLRNGLETSRHNISQDQSLHLGQDFSNMQLHTDRKTCSVGLRTSRILQAHNQNEQSDVSGQPRIEYADCEVQTETIVCFSDIQQAKTKGYYECYFEQNQIQTQSYRNNKVQDVGIQVQFTIEMSSQTDISQFTSKHQKSTFNQLSDNSNSDFKQIISTIINLKDAQLKLPTQKCHKTEGIYDLHVKYNDQMQNKQVGRQYSSQCYETDINYTQTVNKKNVFKINLSLQRMARNGDIDEREGKVMSSRVEKSTARDSEGFTDRKTLMTPKSSHRQSIYQEELPHQFQAQDAISEEDTTSQKDNQKVINNRQTTSQQPNYRQIGSLSTEVQVGTQTQDQTFTEIYFNFRQQRNYQLTQQSEDQHEDKNFQLEKLSHKDQIVSKEDNSSKDSFSDQFTVKKEKGRIDERQYGDQSTKDKSKKKHYDIQQDFEKPHPLIDKFNEKINDKPKLHSSSGKKETSSKVRTLSTHNDQGSDSFSNLTLTKNIHSKSNHLLRESPKYSKIECDNENQEFECESESNLTALSEESLGKQLIQSLFDVQQECIQLHESLAPKDSTGWDVNQIYIIKTCLEQDESVRDEFLLWKNGIFSLKSQQYLRANSRGVFVSDPKMLILGNSEITAWGSSLWIRNSCKKTRCFEGPLKDGNWRVLARYCYTIQQ